MSDWLSTTAAASIVAALVYLATRYGKDAENAPVAPLDGAATGPDGASLAKPEESTADIALPPEATRSVTVETTSTKMLAAGELPKMEYEEDDDVDPTKVGSKAAAVQKLADPVPTKRIVYDEDAESDAPTQPSALILVTATAQTDKGLRRKRNEDNLLIMSDEGVYVVADGMGGYRGGEIASELATKTIQRAFRETNFAGPAHTNIPRRASELVRAVQMANEAILERAGEQKELEGMGTTICAARFSPNKQRLYIAHVGDSRMYRMRDGKLRQMTSDHTMADLGVTGEGASHLSRAVGVWPIVPVDVILGTPVPNDIYLICSDGLTKMLEDERIESILATGAAPSKLVDDLVTAANESGGKDNITVILVAVYAPTAASPPS